MNTEFSSAHLLTSGWIADPLATVTLYYQVDFTRANGPSWIETKVDIERLIDDALNPSPPSPDDGESWSPTFAALRDWLASASGDSSALGAPGSDLPRGKLQFQWFGSTLFCAKKGVARFVKELAELHPEIRAKELEMQMAARLAPPEAGPALPGTGAPAARRRRAGV